MDPVKLQNAHVAWMAPIDSCRGMALEIIPRSEAPNDAWQKLESHYRTKRTRKILRLSTKKLPVEMVPNQIMGEMVLEGGGQFILAGIDGFHTLSLLLASLVAHDRATEDTHTHTGREHKRTRQGLVH